MPCRCRALVEVGCAASAADTLDAQVCHEVFEDRAVVGLAGGDQHDQRSARTVDQMMNLDVNPPRERPMHGLEIADPGRRSAVGRTRCAGTGSAASLRSCRRRSVLHKANMTTGDGTLPYGRRREDRGRQHDEADEGFHTSTRLTEPRCDEICSTRQLLEQALGLA